MPDYPSFFVDIDIFAVVAYAAFNYFKIFILRQNIGDVYISCGSFARAGDIDVVSYRVAISESAFFNALFSLYLQNRLLYFGFIGANDRCAAVRVVYEGS